MSNLFTRALGSAAGVQLNPLRDNSQIVVEKRDQYFAAMLKLTRGRIDKPFFVSAGDISRIGSGIGLGKKTVAYKSHVAVIEALKNGAAGAVLQRLVGSDAVNKFIVVKSGTSIKLTPTLKNGVIKTVAVTNQGSDYDMPNVVISEGTGAIIYVDIDDSGAIKQILVRGGTGYTNSSTITITGTGTSATAHLTNVPASGGLTGATVVMDNEGSGYEVPTVTATGSGSGATFIVRMRRTGTGIGLVALIFPDNAGFGYTVWDYPTTPSVLAITDSSGGYDAGTGATARITDTADGVITAITAPVSSGDYLNSVPAISIKNINGGIGSGAQATATVTAGDISAVTVVSGGSGYVAGKILVTANLATNPSFTLSNTLPDHDVEPYLMAIKDLECINDGVIVSMHSESVANSSGVDVDTKKIVIKIIDPKSPRSYRYVFTGDLTDNGLDDYGFSTFLPDVISRKTEVIEAYIGGDAFISKDSLMYGDDEDGEERWVSSGVLKAFVEGDAAYTTATYVAARNKLINTPLDFHYISSLDTDSVAMIKELAYLSYATNRNLRFDVQGDTYLEAIAFINSLNIPERLENHLLHAFWCPVLAEDPTSQNGSMQMGAATLNVAYACLRNARRNSRGFAPKNYPIMGKRWPLGRSRKNLRALQTLTRAQLNALAKAKINPVIYEDGQYIFADAITCAQVDVSLRKLIAVTDMSTSLDDGVTRFCNSVKGYPMEDAIKLTKDYLKTLFEGAEAAGWLVPSLDPDMLGKSFKYEVIAHPDRPYDSWIVNYWLRYAGTARQAYVTQTYIR
jgi:hypothetical protein